MKVYALVINLLTHYKSIWFYNRQETLIRFAFSEGCSMKLLKIQGWLPLLTLELLLFFDSQDEVKVRHCLQVIYVSPTDPHW